MEPHPNTLVCQRELLSELLNSSTMRDSVNRVRSQSANDSAALSNLPKSSAVLSGKLHIRKGPDDTLYLVDDSNEEAYFRATGLVLTTSLIPPQLVANKNARMKGNPCKFLQTIVIGSTSEDASFEESTRSLNLLHHFLKTMADQGEEFTGHSATIDCGGFPGMSFQTALFTKSAANGISPSPISIPANLDPQGKLTQLVSSSSAYRYTADNVVEYFDAQDCRDKPVSASPRLFKPFQVVEVEFSVRAVPVSGSRLFVRNHLHQVTLLDHTGVALACDLQIALSTRKASFLSVQDAVATPRKRKAFHLESDTEDRTQQRPIKRRPIVQLKIDTLMPRRPNGTQTAQDPAHFDTSILFQHLPFPGNGNDSLDCPMPDAGTLSV